MKSLLIWLFPLLAGSVLAFWFLTRPDLIRISELPDHIPDFANGERIFHAGGCASCHGVDLAGGLELKTAFGTFRVPNISPDLQEGIGAWSTLEFVNAMMRGVSPDGVHYYPAFPYASYTRMDLRDVIDLKARLDAFEPTDSRIGAHEIGFPWNLRRGIGLWKMRYLDPDLVTNGGSVDVLIKTGRYLVEGPGHCAECHTPRDRFGGLDRTRWMAGGPSPDGEGRVPNITPHPDGLAGWTEKDIAYFLESGFTPDFDLVGGTMVEVQENIAKLEASDRAAIAAYLKSIQALPDPHD